LHKNAKIQKNSFPSTKNFVAATVRAICLTTQVQVPASAEADMAGTTVSF
jgi:hypothetical protein